MRILQLQQQQKVEIYITSLITYYLTFYNEINKYIIPKCLKESEVKSYKSPKYTARPRVDILTASAIAIKSMYCMISKKKTYSGFL